MENKNDMVRLKACYCNIGKVWTLKTLCGWREEEDIFVPTLNIRGTDYPLLLLVEWVKENKYNIQP